jgi:hypothetical protein
MMLATSHCCQATLVDVAVEDGWIECPRCGLELDAELVEWYSFDAERHVDD